MNRYFSFSLPLLFLFCGSITLCAQKTQVAVKLSEKLKIDGELDPLVEAFSFRQNKTTASAPSANFVQYSPNPLAPATFETEVWVG